MGVSNSNLDEVLKTNPKTVGALKIFMGSSTGDMLVDDKKVLEEIFEKSPMLIAVHCEDEDTIKHNTQLAIEKYGDDIPISEHPNIRSAEACYKSTSIAVELKNTIQDFMYFISQQKKNWSYLIILFHYLKKELLLRFVFTICGLMKTIIKKNFILNGIQQ